MTEWTKYTLGLSPVTFVTALTERSDSGDHASQTARRQRKVTTFSVSHADNRHPAEVVAELSHRGTSLVHAKHLSCWIAAAFMLGAGCFVICCVANEWPILLPQWLTGMNAITWTFILGGGFFTIGASVQWIQSMQDGLDVGFSQRQKFRLLRIHDLGYWACLILVVDTVLFNLNMAGCFIHRLASQLMNSLFAPAGRYVLFRRRPPACSRGSGEGDQRQSMTHEPCDTTYANALWNHHDHSHRIQFIR